MNERTKNLTLSALFIALGLVLPLLTGQLKALGNAFLPMHLPVLLCGLIVGPVYGLIVGLVLPILRHFTFGMPPLYPTAISMAFELATYGFVVGFVYKNSRWKCIIALYESLIIAMIAGRFVWGIVQMILLGINGQTFTLQMFMAGAFINAIPGIVFQLIFIPSLMLALHKTGLVRIHKNSNRVKETLKKALSLVLTIMMFTLLACNNQNVAQANPDLKTNEEMKVVESNIGRNEMKPVVYFTKDITADSLVKIYEKLGWTPTGKVGVKISTGEPPRSNYLRAELIGDLVKKVNGTIIECNTAYGGDRSETAMHKQVAKDHGYTDIAEVDIMDEDGDMDIPVTGGKRLTRLITGDHIKKYDSVIVLSHFKGHQMAGYGGAIKNVGIGMSSAAGKVLVHTAGTKTSGSVWYDRQDDWLEALAEMVKGMSDYYDNGKKMTYINVMNRISIDCDCNGYPEEPDIHDIGILASNDPVALDQACLDLVYKADGRESLVNRINGQHGEHTLEHAVAIGLGTREYELVSID